MIILPYAHERQTVQRLPYITFGLIVLNFLIFFFTNFGGSSVDDYYEELNRLHEYTSSHPYLELPQEARQYFEDYQLQQLDALREATNLRDIDPRQLQIEQDALNAIVKKVQSVENSSPYDKWGYTPAKPKFTALFTSMFIHGGWLHLLGNMFFLYLAGCSIEDLWGRPLYTGFYVLSGVVATLMHAAKFSSDAEPLVGASGAIAGLMGAFLVRLYDTKISFFYMIWFWIRGTFKAPAYIMLPLWLADQVFYAMLDDGSYGVAFYAHIGGFLFGAAFAFGMKKFQIEERYIAPKIEKKVGLSQNPDFLRAMNLSETGNYPDALILLHRVVRQDPNHLEAYMEMKRIAEINKDAAAYNKFTASIFDILLRTRDWDLLLDLYREYQASPFRQPLPAKSLLGLGTYFEETLDYRQAAERYEELTTEYPQDPLSMRAYSKLARLYFDKLNDREKAISYFWNSYHHPHADPQWRSALQSDVRKFQIPERTADSLPRPATVVAAAAPAFSAALSTYQEVDVSDRSRAQPGHPEIDATQTTIPEPQNVAPTPSLVPISSERVNLPDPVYDGTGNSRWEIVPSRLEKLVLKGLHVRNQQQVTGLLPWKKIQTISVGKIRMSDPSAPASNRVFMLMDFVVQGQGRVIVYRLVSDEIAFEKLFPGVEQTFEEAFQNFMGIVVKNSAARCIPNQESCLGPNFATYPDVSRYQSRLQEKLAL